MAYIKPASECDCKNCEGKGTTIGTMGFADWRCACLCHNKEKPMTNETFDWKEAAIRWANGEAVQVGIRPSEDIWQNMSTNCEFVNFGRYHTYRLKPTPPVPQPDNEMKETDVFVKCAKLEHQLSQRDAEVKELQRQARVSLNFMNEHFIQRDEATDKLQAIQALRDRVHHLEQRLDMEGIKGQIIDWDKNCELENDKLKERVKKLEEALGKVLTYHKEVEGDIFYLTQPDNGDAFSKFDSIGFIAREALKPMEEKK